MKAGKKKTEKSSSAEERSPALGHSSQRSRTKQLLESKATILGSQIRELQVSREAFLRSYRQDRFDNVAERLAHDTQRAIDQLTWELSEIEFILHAPRGRPPERAYDQALRELERDPKPTLRELAEKFFPHYFPDRAQIAVDMIRQGIYRRKAKQ